eukprot:2890321-Pyramimonas_sp.AAC.1
MQHQHHLRHLPSHDLHPQRHLSLLLHAHLFPDRLQDLFLRRLRSWFPHLAQSIALIPWPEVRTSLLSLPPSWRAA